MKNKFIILPILIIFIILFSFSGCIIVKEKDQIIQQENINTYELAARSSIKMSDVYVRSEIGDMIAALPDGWFFIEPSGSISSEVFAIAVNPDYTMSAIFSHLKKNDNISSIVEKEGLIGLARYSYSKHSTKSNNGMVIIDTYKTVTTKPQNFGYYSFVKSKDNTYGCSASFVSSINEYYEFSLVTMNFTSNNIPTRIEFDNIFNSILATLKY